MELVKLTKLTGEAIVINPRYIMLIEKTPDTVVTLSDGSKIIVKESPEEISKDLKEKSWTDSH